MGYLVSLSAAAPVPAKLKIAWSTCTSRSSADDFGCRLNWPVYYGIMVGFFCLFLAICSVRAEDARPGSR